MPERVRISENAGSPQFRISKPGKAATSADLEDFIIHEQAELMKPHVSGSAVFATDGSQTIAISALSNYPFIIVKASDNSLPGSDNFYAALHNDLNKVVITNFRSIARTIYYYVFDVPTP